MFSVDLSIKFALAAIIGGLGTALGPFLGSALVTTVDLREIEDVVDQRQEVPGSTTWLEQAAREREIKQREREAAERARGAK